jgi:hypothetical protein
MSYRRTDSADVAGRIADRLILAFSKGNVFWDVESIPVGADFRRVIEAEVMRADAIVVVIGPMWLKAANASGNRRLDDKYDFIKFELESALRLGKVIIPVLVRGARMPGPDDLPGSIRDIAFRTAVQVRPDSDFHRDMNLLIQAIKSRKAEKYHSPRSPRSKPPTQPSKGWWSIRSPRPAKAKIPPIVRPGRAAPSRRNLYAVGAFVVAFLLWKIATSGIGPTEKPNRTSFPILISPPKVMPVSPSKTMPSGYIPDGSAPPPAPSDPSYPPRASAQSPGNPWDFRDAVPAAPSPPGYHPAPPPGDSVPAAPMAPAATPPRPSGVLD